MKKSPCATCKNERVVRRGRLVSYGVGAKLDDIRFIAGRTVMPDYAKPKYVVESVWCPKCMSHKNPVDVPKPPVVPSK